MLPSLIHRRALPHAVVALAALLLVAVQASPPADTGPPIEYRVTLENRDHHLARVAVTFPGLEPGTLEVRMSRTSPGRYALHEFAKNVFGVEATDRSGRHLELERPDPHQWNVSHSGHVEFRYTLFGDRTDGTYASIDRHHAHLNVPASFVWARGLEERPVRVVLERPADSWRIATQLAPTRDAETFTAPDLAYFIDSPIEMSEHQVYEWSIPGPQGGDQSIALAIHHRGTSDEAKAFAALAQLVVDEQIGVFGEPPRFDFGRYVFIADYLAHAAADGMEHRNSTILTSAGTLKNDALGLLETLAHEFFHAWNVERLRPRSLEPFDLEDANVSGELWFAEGFTSYYASLVLKRAGVISLDRFARDLGAALDATINAPARRYRSPIAMSQHAPFVDAARWIDPTNERNTYLSYYTYGEVLGLGLDLLLRTRFERTLDDYMRALWHQLGHQEISYRLEDLRRVLGEVAGDARWAAELFERSIEGSELPDFVALLSRAGLLLRQRSSGRAWIGSGLEPGEEGLTLLQTPLAETPLYRAGLDRGDLIVSLAGEAITSLDRLEHALAGRRPGQTVTIRVRLRGADALEERDLLLGADPSLELVPYEQAGRTISAEMASFRRAWLGPVAAPRQELRRSCPQCRRQWPLEYEHCPIDGQTLPLIPDLAPPENRPAVR